MPVDAVIYEENKRISETLIEDAYILGYQLLVLVGKKELTKGNFVVHPYVFRRTLEGVEGGWKHEILLAEGEHEFTINEVLEHYQLIDTAR